MNSTLYFLLLTFFPPVMATFSSFRWQNLAYVLTGRPVRRQKEQTQDQKVNTQTHVRSFSIP